MQTTTQSSPAAGLAGMRPDSIPLPELFPSAGPYHFDGPAIPRERWLLSRRMRDLASAGAICLDIRAEWPLPLQVGDWPDTSAVCFIVRENFEGLPALLEVADFVRSFPGFVPPRFTLDPAIKSKWRSALLAGMRPDGAKGKRALELTTTACAAAFSPSIA